MAERPQKARADEREKVTFYLTPEQVRKLDGLAHEYNGKGKGRRIKRTDIIRYLIDRCTMETLSDL